MGRLQSLSSKATIISTPMKLWGENATQRQMTSYLCSRRSQGHLMYIEMQFIPIQRCGNCLNLKLYSCSKLIGTDIENLKSVADHCPLLTTNLPNKRTLVPLSLKTCITVNSEVCGSWKLLIRPSS